MEGPISTAPDIVVETTGGKIRGFRRGDIRIFKGIPYGQPAQGAARFLPPQPIAPWTGVRTALSYGAVCPQPLRLSWGVDETQFLGDWNDGYAGEDCLRLNIWASTEGTRKPVMLWLHGGGFTTGSAQELPAYDGARLAARGVVLVSINHRLGPLGFMDCSQIGGADFARSGNVGMLDIVLALQWIRDNIAAFGGDPDRVTIFGQSGGGMKVSALLGMPSAQGLFHRAIIQSGSIPMRMTQGDAQRLAAATMRELQLAPRDMDRLRNIPAAALIEAGARAINGIRQNGSGPHLPAEILTAASGAPLANSADAMAHRAGWEPSIDGEVVPEALWAETAPTGARHIPMIVGAVRDEIRNMPLQVSEQDLPGRLSGLFGARGPAVLTAVRKAWPEASAKDVYALAGSLKWRNDGLRQAALKQKQGGAATYNYWFTWASPMLDGLPGVFHGLDLPFCFDNTHRSDQATGDTLQARALADRMARAWVAFAATGNPALPDLPWAPFDPARVSTMVFNDRPGMVDDPFGEARALTT